MELIKRSSFRKEEYVRHVKEVNVDLGLFHRNAVVVVEEGLTTIDKDQ